MYWFIGRRSALSMHNKLMMYKQILKPVWTYGIELWGCTKQKKEHEERLLHHINVEAIQLLDNSELVCRLKKSLDLV